MWEESHFLLFQHPSLKDKDGHLIFHANCLLQDRYKTLSVIGKGTFGQVFKCRDTVQNTLCAVKVVRALRKYYDASQIEVRVLECLKQHDPSNQYQCIQLRATFQHDGHVCIVFDLLQLSLFDYMKLNAFAPFPLHQIRDIAYQLLKSLTFLHGRKLIHTDLKPENIMLSSVASKQEYYLHPQGELEKRRVLKDTSVQLIDFGSATFENEFHSSVVSTRHYRAPEIILGLGWSFPCDIWSLGCVLYELYTGETLFQARKDDSHLLLMEATIGPLPAHLLVGARSVPPAFL
ncbi:kinase-like domain-containing protein [Dichotomocladium elegans]|nr:kinase-like domain-containing protein [Dichotomocladium elegans]